MFWNLCDRQYDALVKIRDQEHDRQLNMIAALRADIHNTAGKSFERHMEPGEFMPGYAISVEERAKELMAQGMSPAAAVAVACRKGTAESNIRKVEGAIRGSHRKNRRTKGK